MLKLLNVSNYITLKSWNIARNLQLFLSFFINISQKALKV